MSNSQLYDPYVIRVGDGLRQIAKAIPQYLLPWALFVAFAAWKFRKMDSGEIGGIDWRGMLALKVTAATVLFSLFGIVAIGANNVSARYLYPIFLVAPIGVAAWLTPRVNCIKFAQLLASIAAVLCVLLLFTRLGMFYVQDFPKRFKDGHLIPYAALAEKLTAYKLDDAAIVTLSSRDAGNLISLLPRVRVQSLRTERLHPFQSILLPGLDCVALWGEKYRISSDPPREMVVPEVFRLLMSNGIKPQIEKLDIKWRRPLIGAERVTTWYLLRGPAVRPICRAKLIDEID